MHSYVYEKLAYFQIFYSMRKKINYSKKFLLKPEKSTIFKSIIMKNNKILDF